MTVFSRIFRVLSQIKTLDNFLLRFSNGYLDISRGFSYDIETNGEKQMLEMIGKNMEGLIFFDVGANVGEWSCQAINALQVCQGHLFEPTPRTWGNLKKNFENNADLRLNQLALSDINGIQQFCDYGENFGRNSLLVEAPVQKRPHKIIDVNCQTGDEYCQRRNVERINILKIDTEGVDFLVLKGFEKMLKTNNIDIIQFEYGYAQAYFHTLMSDFFIFFESCGYIVGPLRRSGVKFKSFSPSDNDFRSGPNYVACLPRFRSLLSHFVMS